MSEFRKKFTSHVFLVVVLTTAVLSFLFFQKKQREALYLEDVTTQQQYQLKALIYSLNNIADAIFSNIVDKEEVLSLMAKASKGTAKEQQHQRTTLYDTLLPLYENLQKQSGASLFHFHLPGGTSFLRFHRSSLFGDSLGGTRRSVAMVNETGKAIKGFEEGPVFFGFRNVYPLYSHGEFVGSVELSFSFLAIRDLATRIFPAIYTFMLQKEIVDRVVLANAQSMYKSCKISSHHVKLEAVSTETQKDLLKLDIISFSALKKLNSQLRGQVEKKLLSGLAFSITAHVPEEETILLVTFLPIKNISGDVAAYFVSYQDDTTLNDSHRRLSRVMAGVFFLSMIALVVGYFYFRQESKKDLYENMAMTDRLTKVANRQHFDLIFDQVVKEAERRKESFSLVLLDIDDFKRVNDTYGHDAGDKVLIFLAALLKNNVREQDFVSRWGGEEFTLILPETSQGPAFQLCQKLRRIVEESDIKTEAGQLKITCSFGLAEYGKGLKRDDLLRRADNALYRAKRTGKNRVVIGES